MEQQQMDGTAEERAAKVEKAIRCVLGSGVKLKKNRYILEREGECFACAIGSLAKSLGVTAIVRQSDRVAFVRSLSEREETRALITPEEADNLEYGFEGRSCFIASRADVGAVKDAEAFGQNAFTAPLPRPAMPSPDDPFYRLGRRLAEEVGK